MNILILCDGIYPYVVGGMQNHSFYLTRHLLKEKVNVTLYHCVSFNSPLPESGKTKALLLEGIKGDVGSFQEKIFRFPAAGRLPGHYIRNSERYSKILFQELRSTVNDFDLVFAQGFSAWELVVQKRTGFKCPPVGVHFHGLNMFQKVFSFKAKLQQLMFRPPVIENLKKADIVFAYGGKILEIIQSLNISSSKIIMQPNGIEDSWFNGSTLAKSSSVRRFLFIGRNERLKGFEELNHAIGQLKGNNFEFHFVGDLPVSARIDHPSVFYHGLLDQTSLQNVIAASDVLVVPSWSEGMPTVILEAMSKYLSVIATDTGAVSDMVTDETGWLIPTGDLSALVKALESAIHLPGHILDQKKQKSFELAYNTFRWEIIIKKFLSDIRPFVRGGI